MDAAVAIGRYELPPLSSVEYLAYIDPSGGSQDSMALAIVHRDEHGRAILDAIREVRAPFSPSSVVLEFSVLLKQYRIHEVVGDRYGGSGRVSSSAISGSPIRSRRASRPTTTSRFCRS